ncbi:MAG: hypothetical protein R3C61_03305 [Bacteroidia bacterium]
MMASIRNFVIFRKIEAMNVLNRPLSDLQLELLQLYSQGVPEEDLIAIKRLLAKYFADRASDEMDRLWAKNKWTNETMNKWIRGDDSKGSDSL